MSEELLQRGYLLSPEKIGHWLFYNLGSTTLKSLAEHGIIPRRDYGKLAIKKPDALIVDGKRVVAVIEYKKPSEFKTEKQRGKAVSQELEVARKLGAKIYIATDTKETIWINAIRGDVILDQNGKIVSTNFDKHDENMPSLISLMVSSIDEKTSQLKSAKEVNPTPLAKQIWQDIWSVSGATPENCLYSFVEFFIFKYLSDLGILDGMNSFDHVIKLYDNHSDEEVLEFYVNSVRKKIKEDRFPRNEIDGTTIINGTIFVSKDEKAVKGYSSVFKRILFRFKEYGKLENIDRDFKSQLFESFLKESISKKNWGQYFTPLRVVKAIEKMVDLKEGDVICDPACGVGKFLLEAISDDIGKYFTVSNGKIISKITMEGFDKGFDNDEQKTIILAKANMLIYFSDLIKEHPEITKEFSQLFNQTFLLKTNSILGTLANPIENKYDWILTNPPYVTSGSSNLKEEIRKSGLEYYYKINASGSEGLFMEWIITALKKNGKAFVIVPDGIFLRNNLMRLREFIAKECVIDCIIGLPTKTFFTTPKRTYILGLTKKNTTNVVQSDPIFCYLVSEIGESRDVYRFEIPEDHLTDAINLYNQFKGSKKFFQSHDKRCKIIKFDSLSEDLGNWLIEKFWTEEEKIELGIEQATSQVSLLELVEEFEALRQFLEETISELNDLRSKVESQSKFKEVSVFDESCFSLIRGKRITKKEINTQKGKIPVYSSSKDGDSVLGYIDEAYLQKMKLIIHTKPSVLFNLDGSVGKCFVKRDEKYSFIDVVAAITPVVASIDLEYLKYALENGIVKTGADYQTKLYFNKMKSFKLAIKIPCKENGEFDLELQKDFAKKYAYIAKLKSDLHRKVITISNNTVSI